MKYRGSSARGLLFPVLLLASVSCLNVDGVSDDPAPVPSTSSATTDERWRGTQPLDVLYARIAEDLIAGTPLVIATYCGQWDASKAPEEDIHWGTRFGPWRMFTRARQDEEVRSQYTHCAWEGPMVANNREDPIREAVFWMHVTPNERWNALGVRQPFTIYHVMLLFRDRRAAALEAARMVRGDGARRIALGGGDGIELSAAQIVGYNGHNFYYDGPFDDLHQLHAVPERVKGSFVVGCKTAEYFRDTMVDTNILGLLFTTSFMAPEGYNLLALIDGIAQAKDGQAICEQCNAAYRHFQVLGGQARPGPLFVNQAYGLFESH